MATKGNLIYEFENCAIVHERVVVGGDRVWGNLHVGG
jgi:hypothetical protein